MSATSELVKKLAAGGVMVVASSGEHAGEKVIYEPRSKKDRLPWRLASASPDAGSSYRFSGKDCRTEAL